MSLFSKYKFSNLKKGNVIRFSTFLITAFFFLMLTKFSQSYTQKIKLKVELSNLNDEIILQKDTLNTAYITVKAKGFSLLTYIYNPEKIIKIDAKTETLKQQNTYAWDIKNKKYMLSEIFGKTVEILNINPDTLWFNYDVLDSKNIVIGLERNITFKEGYDVVGDLKLSQDSVKIIGSKSMIKDINFISTELLELDNINTDISIDVKLKNTISNVDIIPNTVTVSGEVRQFTEGKFTLPILLKNAPKNKSITIFPKNVDLVYYMDIKNFKNVKPEDFEIICDYNDVNNNLQNTLELTIKKQPQTVKSSQLRQSAVEFIISD